jgi:two-component system phosphate regulon sensor histidine kinase PhoR
MHPDPLLVLNRRRRIIRGNVAAQELFGDEILGCDLSAAIRDPAVLEAADAALAGDDRRVVDFTLATRADRHYRTKVAPLENCPDEWGAVLLTITDFTEAKRAERLRADFVANASHELRTPLAILLGFLETLTGSAADDPDAQRRFLPIMQQQASRMARLVDDLLALSRIELVEHAPPASRVQLPSILAVVAQALKLRAAGRRMRIELEFLQTLPEVSGDADELGQLFQNLIDNAIKYAAPDTTIVVSAQPSSKLHPGVAVSVRDQGEGIAEQHLSRLTERFYRVDTARSRAVGGTGLGLAIVKHIVNRHRGVLDIESKVGVGSVFTVHLGAAPGRRSADATFDAGAASANAPAAHGRRSGCQVEQTSLLQALAPPATEPRRE